MGCHHSVCPTCGEDLYGYWNMEEDDPEQAEPKALTRMREEHLSDEATLCYRYRQLEKRVAVLEARQRKVLF